MISLYWVAIPITLSLLTLMSLHSKNELARLTYVCLHTMNITSKIMHVATVGLLIYRYIYSSIAIQMDEYGHLT